MEHCETTREIAAFWSGFTRALSTDQNLDPETQEGFRTNHEQWEELLRNE